MMHKGKGGPQRVSITAYRKGNCKQNNFNLEIIMYYSELGDFVTTIITAFPERNKF